MYVTLLDLSKHNLKKGPIVKNLILFFMFYQISSCNLKILSYNRLCYCPKIRKVMLIEKGRNLRGIVLEVYKSFEGE